MKLTCSQCGKPKQNNKFDLCLICYTETLSPEKQTQIKSSDKYKAILKLQTECPTLDDLLNHKIYRFEQGHNPTTFVSKEKEYIYAFNLILENYTMNFMAERISKQREAIRKILDRYI